MKARNHLSFICQGKYPLTVPHYYQKQENQTSRLVHQLSSGNRAITALIGLLIISPSGSNHCTGLSSEINIQHMCTMYHHSQTIWYSFLSHPHPILPHPLPHPKTLCEALIMRSSQIDILVIIIII